METIDKGAPFVVDTREVSPEENVGVMDIQKIKELALVNGFSLKEQASGNMDLHSYVYEFAQAIVVETLNQAQLVYGQEGVTTFDTESLDNEISSISSEFEAEYFFDNDDADRLEMLIAKAMRLGELYERQKWQAAKASAVPESNALLSASLDAIQKLGSGDFVLVPIVPSSRMVDAVRKCYEGEAYLPYSLYSEFINQAMIEAQEPSHD